MRSGVMRARRRERVLVTLKSGSAFEGLLYEYDAKTLVLREASMLGGPQPRPVDGELIALWADVDYLQRP